MKCCNSRVHGLLGGDVCEPVAQATSLSSLVPNPVGIKMRSIPYPIKFLPLEGWKVKDVLFLLPLVPTQSGVLKQQLALSVMIFCTKKTLLGLLDEYSYMHGLVSHTFIFC